MRQPLTASIAWVALLLTPSVADADAFELFHLDPTRSFLAYMDGNLSTQVSATIFPFFFPTAQPGAGQTDLSGDFVVQVGGDLVNPTFFRMLPGLSDIRPADANTVSPGTGGGAGTTDAAFGLSFLDATTALGGSLAIHDLVFSTDGFFSIGANPLGPVGLSGDMAWTVAAGTVEIATSIGLGGTAFLPLAVSFDHFLFANQTQYSEVSPGVFELLLPFSFTVAVGPIDSGPLTNTNGLFRFTGSIVASNTVPEPGTGLLVGLGLAAVAARRHLGGTR